MRMHYVRQHVRGPEPGVILTHISGIRGQMGPARHYDGACHGHERQEYWLGIVKFAVKSRRQCREASQYDGDQKHNADKHEHVARFRKDPDRIWQQYAVKGIGGHNGVLRSDEEEAIASGKHGGASQGQQ